MALCSPDIAICGFRSEDRIAESLVIIEIVEETTVEGLENQIPANSFLTSNDVEAANQNFESHEIPVASNDLYSPLRDSLGTLFYHSWNNMYSFSNVENLICWLHVISVLV